MACHRVLWLCGAVVSWAALASVVQAARPTDSLLSSATKAYVSIPDVPRLRESFNRTQLGRLLSDPAMKPFQDDLHRQFQAKGVELRDKIGLSIEDLDTLATGELTISVAKTAEGKAAVMILVDVSDNVAAAQATLERNTAQMIRQGARKSARQAAGTSLVVLDVPPKGPIKEWTQAIYFVKEGLLGIGDHAATVAEVLTRMAVPAQDTLASVKAYQEVLKRASQGASDFHPQITWYVDPVGLVDALRAGKPKKSGPDIFKLAKAEGLDAVQAAGGLVSFSSGQYGLMYRTAIYAPGPFRRSTQMLKFDNGGDFTPPPWVPNDVSAFTSFQWDMKHAFDHFGTLFDTLFGEGEEGVWQEVLDGLKEDPNGPRLDVRNDLVAHLGHRAMIITDNVLPATPHSQRRLIAAESTNDKLLAKAVALMMKNDKSVVTHDFQGHRIYEIIPEDRDIPDLDVEQPGGKKQKQRGAEGHAKAPNSAVAVGHGHLFISTHVDFLQKVLAQAEAEAPLASDGEYRFVAREVNKLLGGAANNSLQGFARNSEKWFLTYEMFRQGKLPETETPLAGVLNAVLNDGGEGELRKPRLDGSKLPEFDVVRSYLGNSGQVVTSEPNGWFLIGFTLNKDARAATQARRPGATD